MAHRIQVFPGRHDWPTSPVAVEALEWMELQAIKSGKRKREDTLIENIWQMRLRQARDLEASHQTYEAYQAYAALADSFQGLRDTTTVANAANQLHETSEVRTAIRDELQQIKKQREIELLLSNYPAAGADTFRQGGGGRRRARRGHRLLGVGGGFLAVPALVTVLAFEMRPPSAPACWPSPQLPGVPGHPRRTTADVDWAVIGPVHRGSDPRRLGRQTPGRQGLRPPAAADLRRGAAGRGRLHADRRPHLSRPSDDRRRAPGSGETGTVSPAGRASAPGPPVAVHVGRPGSAAGRSR